MVEAGVTGARPRREHRDTPARRLFPSPPGDGLLATTNVRCRSRDRHRGRWAPGTRGKRKHEPCRSRDARPPRAERGLVAGAPGRRSDMPPLRSRGGSSPGRGPPSDRGTQPRPSARGPPFFHVEWRCCTALVGAAASMRSPGGPQQEPQGACRAPPPRALPESHGHRPGSTWVQAGARRRRDGPVYRTWAIAAAGAHYVSKCCVGWLKRPRHGHFHCVEGGADMPPRSQSRRTICSGRSR